MILGLRVSFFDVRKQSLMQKDMSASVLCAYVAELADAIITAIIRHIKLLLHHRLALALLKAMVSTDVLNLVGQIVRVGLRARTARGTRVCACPWPCECQLAYVLSN